MVILSSHVKNEVLEWRRSFVNINDSINLAACSQGALLKSVKKAFSKYQADQIEFGNPWDIWQQKVEELRSLIGKLINASKNEIAILPSVSASFSSLLSSIDFCKNDQIITTDLEYPTTNFISLAQKYRGVETVTVRNKNGIVSSSDYESNITDKTRLGTVIHVSSLNGTKLDLKEFTDILHQHGSYAYVDAYQSLGVLPVNVKNLNIDFLSSGTLKWLLGASGTAFLYAREEVAEKLYPTDIGWFSQQDPFQFGAEKLQYADGALRFQSGTWSVPSIYASIEGIKKILEIGQNKITRRIETLTSIVFDELTKNGFTVNTPESPENRGGIIAFEVSNPMKIEKLLRDKYRIFTSARGINLRISPHFYNNEEEVLKTVDALVEIRNKSL